MRENLLLIFAKNPQLGKSKTRLAATIGDENALTVYKELLRHTEAVSESLIEVDVRVCYTNYPFENYWTSAEQVKQSDGDLGQRMNSAFMQAFKDGYKRVVGIGTDLPELTSEDLHTALKRLEEHDFVFGPSKDGGYYVIGLNSPELYYIFEDMPWSTDQLLTLTLERIKQQSGTYSLLPTRNDIDTIDDLMMSSLKDTYKHLIR